MHRRIVRQVVVESAPDQPLGSAAAQVGHDDAAGQKLRPAARQQPNTQGWSNRQPVPSQVRGELVTWCVTETAALDGGRIETATGEVRQRARLGEQGVVIERNRCLQDRQLVWIASTACAWRWVSRAVSARHEAARVLGQRDARPRRESRRPRRA